MRHVEFVHFERLIPINTKVKVIWGPHKGRAGKIVEMIRSDAISWNHPPPDFYPAVAYEGFDEEPAHHYETSLEYRVNGEWLTFKQVLETPFTPLPFLDDAP